jgi:hypothetical protein
MALPEELILMSRRCFSTYHIKTALYNEENKLKREREIGVSTDAGDNIGSLRARSHVQLDQPAG